MAASKIHSGFSLTLVVLILGFSAPRVAAVDACGLISGTWSEDVRVTCDLNIADLDIAPGVKVRVLGDFGIEVSGRIRALGMKDAPITIEPDSGNADGWRGFSMQNTIDGSEFRWTTIRGATQSAIRIFDSSPIIENVIFEDNLSELGGAIYAELTNKSLQITNSRFEQNHARIAGGAIHFAGGTSESALRLVGNLFKGNTAGTTSTRADTEGGALALIGGNTEIVGSVFRSNESRAFTIFAPRGRFARGGAIFGEGGQITITASVFEKNACRLGAHGFTPDVSHARGGAVYLLSGELIMRNSIVAGNELITTRRGDERGAGVYSRTAAGSIINSTFVDNSDHAIFEETSTLAIQNAIIFFNNGNGDQMRGSPDVTYSNVQGYAVGQGEGNFGLNPILVNFVPIKPSPSIDASNMSPEFFDIFPPGQGTERGDQGATGGPFASFPVMVDGGDDQRAIAGDAVVLNGTRTVDFDQGAFAVLWLQRQGPAVQLIDSDSLMPVFAAPAVDEHTSLVFELTVDDGSGGGASDTVAVVVAPTDLLFLDSFE